MRWRQVRCTSSQRPMTPCRSGLAPTDPWLLPYIRTSDMVVRMKTTLVIDDTIVRRVKERAAAESTTISEIVEAALRLLLDRAEPPRSSLPPLPSWDGGGAQVDISDREALYRAMER